MKHESLLGKIKALLNKTVENGCTEAEALAALGKARAIMDAYEVTEADLQLSREESAVLRAEPPGSKDPHGIKSALATSVAKFCDCEVWKSTNGLVFCGLPSDAQFATWLLDNLTSFVQGELVNHLIGCIVPKGQRRFIINGFVAGCARRISERISALCQQSATDASSNGRALALVKSTAVADKLKKLNIHLQKGRRSGRRLDNNSYQAGKVAGDRASFGRPVSGDGGVLRLTND
jgi:hypothetical protein